jgi:nucleoside-diphosphate-sugar epimerase
LNNAFDFYINSSFWGFRGEPACTASAAPNDDEAMTGRIAIFGYGPVGRAIAERLSSEGRELVVAQRRAPPGLPKGAAFTPCDALDAEAVVKAARGADQIVVAIGFDYSGVVWRDAWPKAMANFVAACKTTGARMAFIDNVYMYGPQTAPLVETMPLADTGWKPAARSAATRIWMAAAAAGEVRVAALRAPDFYGPGVGNSYLGDTSIGKLARGKPAVFIGSPDVLHDYAYVPDIARAATTLLAAPDAAFGQAWHVPCAPTRTTRDILKIAADALGVRLRISAMPAWIMGTSAMFSPFLRELIEMRFQWDRPYHIDASKFAKAFWSDATPFETGARDTALAFRAMAKRRR